MIIRDSRVCGLTTNFKALLVSPYCGAFLLIFRKQLLSFSQFDDLWGWQMLQALQFYQNRTPA